jgi:MOSC domain-containing protein
VMTTLAQADLPRDPAVLQTIARHNRFDIPGLGPSSCVGVYALVTTGGTARQGDPVEIA